MLKKVLILGVILLLAVAGCSTIKGMAHDISWTADKIDQSIVVQE